MGKPKESNAALTEVVRQHLDAGADPFFTNWHHKTGDAQAIQRSAVLSRVKNRKVDGKPFMGHGSWYAYLENELGLNPTSSAFMPDERLNHAIGRLLQNGMNGAPLGPKASAWINNHTLISGAQTTPHALYLRVNRRVKNGKPFQGHSTWDAYLEHVHGLEPVTPQYKLPDKRLNRLIGLVLQDGVNGKPVSRSSRAWHESTEPAVHTGHSLRKLFDMAQHRLKDGTPFMGHGSWAAYLHHVHNTGPLASQPDKPPTPKDRHEPA